MMRTGTPACQRAMISVEYRLSVMNQNDTSMPDGLGPDAWMIGVRQSSNALSQSSSRTVRPQPRAQGGQATATVTSGGAARRTQSA